MASTISVKVTGRNDRVTFTDADGNRVTKSFADAAFDMPTGEYAALGPNGRNVVKADGTARVAAAPVIAPPGEPA